MFGQFLIINYQKLPRIVSYCFQHDYWNDFSGRNGYILHWHCRISLTALELEDLPIQNIDMK